MIGKNGIRFFALILLQVLVLNHISLGGYINPYFYIYFILLLPVETPKWVLLVSAFCLGLGVDLFSNTLGLNAAATVAMAFTRPFVIRMVSPGTMSEASGVPSISNQGLKWFVYYSATLVLIHHFILFYLEVFRFSEFFSTLLRVILSSLFTMLLVVIAQYLFYPRKS